MWRSALIVLALSVPLLGAQACRPAGDVSGGASVVAPEAPGPGLPEDAVTAAQPPLETAPGPAADADLDCAAPAEGSLAWVACNVMDGLRSRNLAALHGYMSEEFRLGPWRSEWSVADPQQVTTELQAYRLPSDPAQPMTFTADHAAFPDLGGVPVETMLGPDDDVVLVLYSEGWEYDGGGAALLYFVERTPGRYAWRALLIAPDGFDG